MKYRVLGTLPNGTQVDKVIEGPNEDHVRKYAEEYEVNVTEIVAIPMASKGMPVTQANILGNNSKMLLAIGASGFVLSCGALLIGGFKYFDSLIFLISTASASGFFILAGIACYVGSHIVSAIKDR